MRKTVNLDVLLFLCLSLTSTWAQNCGGGNTNVGINNPNGGNDGGQTDTYYMVCGGLYQFKCCGIINRWEYFAEIANQQVELIVWRPTGVGSQYTIAFTYQHTAAAKNQQTITPVGNYVIMPGDCLGWHSAGAEVVGYKTGGNGQTALHLPSGSVNVAGATDWSTATASAVSNAEWGIYARVSASSSPTFPAQTVTYSTPETTAVSTSVASVTFSDVDKAEKLTLTLTSSTPSGYFVLVDNGDGTGTINTHATTTLTAISGQTVTMNFLVTDLCGLTATGSITIKVINDPPKLINLPISTDVGEDMLVQTTIATFTCTDSSGVVSVSSTESPSNAPKADFFFTKYVSGNVYAVMARAQTNPAQGTFNYNTQRYYDITVSCSDSIDTVKKVIRADLVPNTPPVINNLPAGTTISVPQTQGVGSVVFTLDFNDADNDTVKFSQTSDPVNCPFIVLDSGEVQVKSSILAYNDVGYDIFITPADGKNAGIQRTLTIKITGINDIPKFTNLDNSVVVDENTAIGTTVFTVSYTDTDVADTHTFFMTNPSSGTSYFDINAAGEVTTKAAINYEALPVKIFPFTVVISDGRSSSTGTLTVTIADVNEPLVWNSATYRIDVLEQTAVGTTLTDPGFAVTDPDAGDTYTCAMDCGGSNGYFAMNTACKVRVSSSYSLDAGLSNTVTCTVTAVDKGAHTATTTLIINILDADNYKPVFNTATYPFTVSSYANSNTAIGTVTATDSDIGSFGHFSYSLDQTGLPGNYFKIDSAGQISTQVNMPEICNCSDITFAVPVLATDTGGLVGKATVYITVLAFTTTTARTTTDRYKTFFDDTKNIVWFSLLMGALAIASVVTVFVCVKYVCTGNPFAGRRRFIWRPREYEREPPRRIEHEYIEPKPRPIETVRQPPPPKGFQFWRSDPQFK